MSERRAKQKRKWMMAAILGASMAVAVPVASVCAEEPTYQLDEMVITATKIPQPLRSIPASVSVITAKDLEQLKVTTVDEALRMVTGAFDNRGKGLTDTLAKVQLRGFADQKRTLVLLDGQPLNQAYTGEVVWAAVPVENVEKIEVVKGAYSSLYGGSAMGGVINIITKKPGGREISAKAAYGTNGTWHESVQFSDSINSQWRISAGYDRKSSDGMVNNYVTKNQPTASGGTNPTVNGWQKTTDTKNNPQYIIGDKGKNTWDQDTYNMSLSWRDGKDKEMDIQLLWDKYDYGYQGYTSYLRNSAGQPVISGTVNLDGKKVTVSEKDFLDGPGGKESRIYGMSYRDKARGLTFRMGMNQVADNWYITPGSAATSRGGAGKISETPGKAWNFEIQQERNLGLKDKVVMGIGYRTDEAHNQEWDLANWQDRDSKVRQTYDAQGKSKTFSIFLQDEHQINTQWSLTTGLRYDRWTTYDGSSWEFGGRQNNYADRSDSAVSPKVALMYKPNEMTGWHLSWGKAFRAPTMYELYRSWSSDTKYYAANPDLKAETASTWELGWDKKIGEKSTMQITYFHNDIKDMIYRRGLGIKNADGKDMSIYDNAGNGKTDGVEVGMTHRFDKRWSSYINYTWQKATIDQCSANPAAEGKRVPMVPEHLLSLGVNYQVDKWNVGVNGNYVSKRYSEDANTDVINNVYGSYDPYFIWNVRLQYQPDKTTTISLGVDNVADRQYYSYYLAPGRTWTLEIKKKF